MVLLGTERVQSPIGETALDADGSPVGAVRLDPQRSYSGVPALLQRAIDDGSVEAWEDIKAKIDYTYESLDCALGALEDQSAFAGGVRSEIAAGKKLLFKPNMVTPLAIDPDTHGEGGGNVACTAWPFVAAVMRWFHDRVGISYHEMAVGEAASATHAMAGRLSILWERPVTTEAVMEGRCGDLYGGWGFYFVRRYLAERHDADHRDDPMRGYEDSVSGNYLPPGRAGDRLPLYDLNRVQPAPYRGRAVAVPNGVNYQTITLHKAVVGGDPSDPEDTSDYPGCVLVNLPKLKVHMIALLTAAIKNLGIGLYPMEAAEEGTEGHWKYAVPDGPFPTLKSRLPHAVWVTNGLDEDGIPKRDASGGFDVHRTGGLTGTMLDIMSAVQAEGLTIISVTDAIETTNVDHTGAPGGLAVAEGYVLASPDIVALDLLSARYMFKSVPMVEGRRLRAEQGFPDEFLRWVPVPRSDGRDIVTGPGIDCILARDTVFAAAEKRGIGRRRYYVTGRDVTTGNRLASLQGHLGSVAGDTFSELITTTLYFDRYKPLWDLQTTVMGYLEANDALTGSDRKRWFLEVLDEDGDGVIGFEEMGKGWGDTLSAKMSTAVWFNAVEPYGFLHGMFDAQSTISRYGNALYNEQGLDLFRPLSENTVALIAMLMSQAPEEQPDPFHPPLSWGKGKWPSLDLAKWASTAMGVYGQTYPNTVALESLYGMAFQYADKAYNGGVYCGVGPHTTQDAAAAERYIQAVAEGAAELPFRLFVPPGLSRCGERPVPNVQETSDPALVFRAQFNGGDETW